MGITYHGLELLLFDVDRLFNKMGVISDISDFETICFKLSNIEFKLATKYINTPTVLDLWDITNGVYLGDIELLRNSITQNKNQYKFYDIIYMLLSEYIKIHGFNINIDTIGKIKEIIKLQNSIKNI